jgi:TetR/AcrR family transcriptional regulator, regulator of cefoperazone and chloramphenicol sensitivity
MTTTTTDALSPAPATTDAASLTETRAAAGDPSRAGQSGQTAQMQTRERLLEAAGQVFAEQGFRRATVRQICTRAGANIAAVNYHFGDKMGLYAAVINHWLGVARDKYPPDLGLGPDPTPEERLHAYVRSYLFRLLGQGAPAWHGRLMAQEMIEPTEVMDTLLAQTIRPMIQRLESIVRDLLGAGATDEQVRACTSSIAGQCCFYRHAEALLTRLYPEHGTSPAQIERLADHVTRFSLQGLRCYGADCREKQ